MKRGPITRLVALICATIGASLSAEALAVVYVFEKIADTSTAAPSGTFTTFIGATASGGTAAFYGSYSGGSGIFRSDGGAATSIVQLNQSTPFGTFANFDGTLPISGNTVAFQASYVGGTGIFTGSGGALTKIVQSGDTVPGVPTLEKLAAPAISGSNVSFRALYSGGAGAGIFMGSGGALTTVVKSGDASPFGTFTTFGSGTALSGAALAFNGSYVNGDGIFSSSGGVLTTIVRRGDPAPSGTFSSVGTTPVISGNNVATVGRYTTGIGIFRGSGGPLTTIALTGGAAPPGAITGFDNFSLGIAGDDVAFEASYSGGNGIFVGNGGPLTTIVKTGDALFGQTLTSLNLSRFGLDEVSGNLAFTYTLNNGVSGVAMAIPVAEPELPGDYNRDGVVDNADYILWRKTFGSPVAYGEGADGNINGMIDNGDYGVWETNFGGTTAGSGGSTNFGNVPEPSGGLPITIGLFVAGFASRRALRPRLRYCRSIEIQPAALAVAFLGLVHDRQCAIGVFEAGGFEDKAADVAMEVHEELLANRTIVVQ
jgi:hypothetical protein